MSEGPPNVHKLPGKKKHAQASQREAASEPAPDPTGGVEHLDATWLLVPGAIVAIALVVLLGLGVNAWLRNRREAAEFSRAR